MEEWEPKHEHDEGSKVMEQEQGKEGREDWRADLATILASEQASTFKILLM